MWVKRHIFHEKYGFLEGRDFTSMHKSVRIEGTNLTKESKDYALTIDCAKHLAMLADSEKGREAREYFIECEKSLKKERDWVSDLLNEMLMKDRPSILEYVRIKMGEKLNSIKEREGFGFIRLNMKEACNRLGISKETGRKWRKKAQDKYYLLQLKKKGKL